MSKNIFIPILLSAMTNKNVGAFYRNPLPANKSTFDPNQINKSRKRKRKKKS